MTDSSVEGDLLFHLTREIGTLAAILREGRLRAVNAYGAVRNHQALRDIQRVACLSEIAIDGLTRLADRRGEFGVGFRTTWAERNGAAPIWYLPNGTQVQQRLSALIRSLAFTQQPRRDHPLWELTPFIDYTGEHNRGSGVTRYDWTWEREWRVHGDLPFEPDEVVVLFAPESAHETVREMWLWEALDANEGRIPPLIDVRWPVNLQIGVVRAGPNAIVSELLDWYETQDAPHPHDGPEPRDDPEPHLDTAPGPRTWTSDAELLNRELRDERGGWWDEFHRDD